MRLGMMQPYFFPYLGYFGLIHAADHWMVFDTPQYIRRGWINRNRVLSAGQSAWRYIRVPVAQCDRSTPIYKVCVHPTAMWREELLNSLTVYRLKNAPYYLETIEFLTETLSCNTKSLTDLIVHCLCCCCEYLGLPFRFETFSKADLVLPDIGTPGQWALETARALGATSYVNPPGGRRIFDSEAFKQARIDLKLLRPALPAYDQKTSRFECGLSIIDALMWNKTATVRDMIADYELIAADSHQFAA
jgi:hypothetical protein